jgi:hypothetical protein
MLVRLLERGKTSGREDDNAESIKKRFSMACLHPDSLFSSSTFAATHHEQTMPVINYYSAKNKVAQVSLSVGLHVLGLSVSHSGRQHWICRGGPLRGLPHHRSTVLLECCMNLSALYSSKPSRLTSRFGIL